MRSARLTGPLLVVAALTAGLAACGAGDPDQPVAADQPSASTVTSVVVEQARSGAGGGHRAHPHGHAPASRGADDIEAAGASPGSALPYADGDDSVAIPGPTRPPAAPGSAAALARVLADLEPALRDPATPERRAARLAQRQQVAYRELALHPSWLHPVLDALPAALRDDALAQVAARQEFLDMSSPGSLNDAPPAGWAVAAPAPAADLLRWYQGAGDEYGVDWTVLAAVNLIETGMGRVRADSSAGAQGPMQFMPGTWARWGHGDVHDPHHAIYGAARYLAASGAADGRLDDALFAYNNDDRYVRAVKRYAGIMDRDPILFRAFYYWQVYYRTSAGDLLLPEGYPDVPAVRR